MEYSEDLIKIKHLGILLRNGSWSKGESNLAFYHFDDVSVHTDEDDDEITHKIFVVIEKNDLDPIFFSEILASDFQFLYAVLEDDSDLMLNSQIFELTNEPEKLGIHFEVKNIFKKKLVIEKS